MTPPDWDRVKEIFAAAVELPEADRAACVEQLCRGDAALAAQVNDLLNQHEDTDSTDVLSTHTLHPIQIGEVVGGRFRIAAFIGRGGMGDVYEAADTELGGTVALKTLRPELVEDPDFLQRFRREVHMARQVTHPNICRIFDLGYDRHPDGRKRVFFTMEYLDGRTLSAHLRGANGISKDQMQPLMQQMAAALAVLHERGIVHRDFKPSNVIVTGASNGQLRAMIGDFGLARAVDAEASEMSRTGKLMGTPGYMAPEQLLGQPATPASDVYALGLVMYEMATGEKAFPGRQAMQDALQRVAEAPSPPRDVTASVSPDLEAVIVRALAIDPAARPTSSEIAAALQGTASLPPIRRTSSPGPRKLRWAAAAVFVLAVALFLLLPRISERLGPDAARSRSAASPQHIALLPVTVAGGNPDLQVFGSGLMETITSRLSQYDAENEQQILVVPASEVRAQNAVKASDARRMFGANVAVEGSIQSQDGRVRLVLTLIDTKSLRQVESIVVEERLSNALGLQDAAVSKLANALKLYLQPRYARDQQALNRLAPGAYEYYLQGRGYLQRSDQPKSVDSAIVVFERALSMDRKFALAHSGLGEAYVSKYRQTLDPKYMELAIAGANQGLQLNPDLPETYISTGNVQIGTGQYAEAQKNFEQAIALDPRRAEAYHGLASAFLRQRDYTRAEATYLKAISIRPGDWNGYRQLAYYYLERREFDKAAEQFRKVIDLSPDNAQAWGNLGITYSLRGLHAEAEKIYLQALSLDPNRLSTLSNLAKNSLDVGKPARAIEMSRRALAINERSHLLWGTLASAYLETGDRVKSIEAFQRAAGLVESEILVNSMRGDLHGRLAFYRAYSGRPDFEEPLRRSLQLAPSDATTFVRAAETYAVARRRDQAIELMNSALKMGYPEDSLRQSRELRGLTDSIRAGKSATMDKR